MPGTHWAIEEINILKQHYVTMNNLADLQQMLPKRSCQSLNYKAWELGLKRDMKLNARKYYHDENFFNQPNLLNSYWAGFIAADGCVMHKFVNGNCFYGLTIVLASKDKNVLERFKSDISYTGDILDSVVKKKGIEFLQDFYYRSCLQIRSANQICADLNEHWNITPRKSLTLQPPIVEDDLAAAYIIGYLDGDGCIRLQDGRLNIKFLGTDRVLYWIKNYFHYKILYGSNYGAKIGYNDRKNSKIKRLQYTGKIAEKIGRYLLDIELPFRLERKWKFVRGLV